MQRTIDGDVLVQHLTENERTLDQDLLEKHGRTARTLVKVGSLRVTLMALFAGGDLPTHSTDGPVSIQLLEGSIVFSALGQDYPLVAGDVLVFAPNVEHSARSARGGRFLLTVVHQPSAGTPVDKA